ncbi:MAG TPA: hypothetical protein VD736_01275, partial [Nitrososphaera sp.]|nr:hypothetical protein [Nitrososphaera sp.]
GELFFVPAFFISRQPEYRAAIRFYVDTGSSKTIVNDLDAYRMNLSYEGLDTPPANLQGVGGFVDSFLLKACSLVFITSSGNELIERLPEVYVLRHENFNPNDRDQLPSLLGLDVLRKYRINFKSKKVILKR